MITKTKAPAAKSPAKKVPEASIVKGAKARRKQITGADAAEIVPVAKATAVRFFLADDMRHEVSGKVTAVGLYADNVIVAEMSKNDPDPTPERMVALPGVSILASVSIRPGEHHYKLEFDGSSVVPPLRETTTKRVGTPLTGETTNLIMRFQPLPFTRFGIARVVLWVDGEAFSYSFEIRRRNVSQV